MDKIINKIAEELNVKNTQVENAVKLIDEGNTIPFIARYRKEATGGLSDEILRDLGERLTYLRNLETRKEEIIKSIDEQGKLTDELTIAIASAETLAEVEDLYRPFKQKKKTRATVAKAKGFNSACKQFDITKKELNDLSLNYGNSSLIKSIESQEGLYGLDKNEDFLKKAFFLKQNELSEPIIISSSVIVLQFTKQSENQTQIEDSVITNEFVTFDTQSADYAIMNSPKLKNNFDKIYTKIFKRS